MHNTAVQTACPLSNTYRLATHLGRSSSVCIAHWAITTNGVTPTPVSTGTELTKPCPISTRELFVDQLSCYCTSTLLNSLLTNPLATVCSALLVPMLQCKNNQIEGVSWNTVHHFSCLTASCTPIFSVNFQCKRCAPEVASKFRGNSRCSVLVCKLWACCKTTPTISLRMSSESKCLPYPLQSCFTI